MQNPIDFAAQYWQNKKPEDLLNLIREYLQVAALKIVYQSKEGKNLRFGGGTALRICYNLPRYSEDLDFELIDDKFVFDQFVFDLKNGFSLLNIETDISVPKKSLEKKVVKFWLKFPKILKALNLSPLKDEKLAIKMEIYKTPPKKGKNESVYVNKFNEYFPILSGELPTLFANKIAAIFDRPYSAPRDFYDLLWYLNQNIDPNYELLQEVGIKAKDRKTLIQLLNKKIENITGATLLSVISRFLENENEKTVLKDFEKIYKKTIERYLKGEK